MQVGVIRIDDTSPTAQEIEEEFKELWKAINKAGDLRPWMELQDLLAKERKRTRVAMLEGIQEGMRTALREEKYRR